MPKTNGGKGARGQRVHAKRGGQRVGHILGIRRRPSQCWSNGRASRSADRTVVNATPKHPDPPGSPKCPYRLPSQGRRCFGGPSNGPRAEFRNHPWHQIERPLLVYTRLYFEYSASMTFYTACTPYFPAPPIAQHFSEITIMTASKAI